MSNIGSVQYSKGNLIGQLEAVWIHADYGHGTGLAIGGPNDKFEGKYHIKYFNEKGILMTELELEITKNKHRYDLTWSKSGVVISIGIGIENSNILSAGYYDV